MCPAGTCGLYSSVGFDLLGLVVAWHNDVEEWYQFDQLSVIPAALRAHYDGAITFPTFGSCLSHPGIIHQYAWWVEENDLKSLHFFDISKTSCLNGWTCGNIAGRPAAVASYFYDLFHANGSAGFVRPDLLQEMRTFRKITQGWGVGMEYGLGLFPENYFPGFGNGSGIDTYLKEAETLGHGGMDYGSGGAPSGYNTAFDFGISFGMGTATGMNCSLSDVTRNGDAWQDTLCKVYDIVLQEVSQGTVGRLNCSLRADQGVPYGVNANSRCNFTLPAKFQQLG